MIKCPKCGAELPDSAKFCASCGEKIESVTPPPIDEKMNKDTSKNSNEKNINKFHFKKGNVKKSSSNKWNNLNFESKLNVIAIIVFVIFGIISFLSGKTGAGIISIIQILLAIVSLLMINQVIKVTKKSVHRVVLILATILVIPFLILFITNDGNSKPFDWDDVILGEVIPEPKSHMGEMISNSEDYLSLDVHKTEITDYKEYVNSCKEKGFTVGLEQLDQSFDAYNTEGYYLSIYLDENDKKMNLTLDASEKFGTFSWPDSGIANMLPAPKSNKGVISQNDDQGLSAKVSGISETDFDTYVEECIEKGFSVEAQKSGKEYSAENAEGYLLSTQYLGEGIMSIMVTEPEYTVSIKVDCVENLMFSQYDVDVYVDDLFQGTVSHGGTETFDLILTKGIYDVRFVNVEDEEVTGSVEIDIYQDESLEYKISCTSSKINVETIRGTVPSHGEDEVAMTKSASSYTYENYEDVQKELSELGFTNISTEVLYDIEIGITEEGEVESVSIEGNKEFEEGDIFKKDSAVVITYHMREDDPNNPNREDDDENQAEHLTVANCPELATILATKDPGDPFISSFASKYYGQVIEFDGCVNNLQHHESFNTRWDVLLGAGDFNPNSATGPNFHLTDVNFYDMNVSGGDSITTGTNVHVVAEVGDYNANSQLFELNIISMQIR